MVDEAAIPKITSIQAVQGMTIPINFQKAQQHQHEKKML